MGTWLYLRMKMRPNQLTPTVSSVLLIILTPLSLINGSYQKCSVALYGEWGTCKTTLMKWELIRSYFPRYKDIIIWLDVNSRAMI